MGYFWFIPPSGGSSGGGTASNVVLYDDLTAQIDGVRTDFVVTKGKFVAGSVGLSAGALEQRKGVNFSELDPATGTIRFPDPPQPGDAPLIARYTY